MNMKKILPALCVGVLLLSLGACAAGSTDAHAAASGGAISQFFLGLWHGIIAPLTLLAEIINWLAPHILPWRPHFFESDAGVAYDIGFYLTLSGGPHLVINGWRRRRP
jgi:hypothetical protein